MKDAVRLISEELKIDPKYLEEEIDLKADTNSAKKIVEFYFDLLSYNQKIEDCRKKNRTDEMHYYVTYKNEEVYPQIRDYLVTLGIKFTDTSIYYKSSPKIDDKGFIRDINIIKRQIAEMFYSYVDGYPIDSNPEDIKQDVVYRLELALKGTKGDQFSENAEELVQIFNEFNNSGNDGFLLQWMQDHKILDEIELSKYVEQATLRDKIKDLRKEEKEKKIGTKYDVF